MNQKIKHNLPKDWPVPKLCQNDSNWVSAEHRELSRQKPKQNTDMGSGKDNQPSPPPKMKNRRK